MAPHHWAQTGHERKSAQGAVFFAPVRVRVADGPHTQADQGQGSSNTCGNEALAPSANNTQEWSGREKYYLANAVGKD